MGYRGKVEERQQARELRAQSWTLAEIATELSVARSSVSIWVRDVDFEPRPRNRGHPAGPKHPMRLKKEAEIARCRAEAANLIGTLSDRDLLIAGVSLYLGEGAKTERSAVRMANTSPAVMAMFMTWLRTFFDVDESRLRARLYLHQGLALDAATEFWSDVVGIPPDRFQRPYRPAAPAGGAVKHPSGCLTVIYSCLPTHRRVMAMVEAVSSTFDIPG